MANGVLGLGSGQASALNNDLLDKLKAADRTATVVPLEKRITNIGTEKTTFLTISAKVAEVLDAIKPFDLFVTAGVTAFEQKAASTSGDSVTFDAADVKALAKGTTTIDVTQLAQKDVYQSNSFNTTDKDGLVNQGELIINGQSFDTTNKTYTDLAAEITAKSGMNASVEQVGTDSYRLVLKGEESGIDNKLTISGNASQSLGYTTDGSTIDPTNHILEAKNMVAKIDGVEYSVSNNSVTVDGLKINAVKIGVSSINITEDNTQLETQMQNFVTKYDELVALVDTEVTNPDSALGDKSSIRNILTQVKDKIFGSYGSSGDKSIFNFGFSLDKNGSLSLDSTKFNNAIETNMADLKDLFVGTAEKKGLGTSLKQTIDEMSFSSGILKFYDSGMTTRETALIAEKDKAEKSLDAKYEQLALQFSSYGTIINQMESSFSGLSMLIQQSTASNN